MNCIECHELISDYVDGTLELGEQTRIEHHLADCEPCRAVRDDLLQIVHFSSQLPTYAPANPAALWERIQAKIEAEQPKTFGARLSAWWQRIHSRDFNFSIPQVATVAVALVIVAAVSVVTFKNSTGDIQSPTVQTANPNIKFLDHKPDSAENPDFKDMEQRINELKNAVEQRKNSWGEDLQMSFERSMVSVDQSLDESRQEFRNNPADEACRELLRNAYREKVRVLEGFANF